MIDIKKDVSWVKNNWSKIVVPLFIVVAFVFAFSIRYQAHTLPVTDIWADSTMNNYLSNNIYNQIKTQYPLLPEAQLQQQANTDYQKYITDNAAEIAQQKVMLSQNYKQQYLDPDGNLYHGDIDPYEHIRNAQNILDHGYIGDRLLSDGRAWNDHTLAPLGQEATKSAHAWFLAYFYKLAKIVSPSITLAYSASFFPAILVALATIPAFFLVRKISSSNIVALIIAMLFSVIPGLAWRTPFGAATTSAYSVFFPLVIVWMLVESLCAEDYKRYIYAVLMGLFLGLYAWVWSGWWYVSNFIFGAMGITTIYFIIRKNWIEAKKHIYIALSFFISATCFVSAFATTGFKEFIFGFLGPLDFITHLKSAVQSTLWPNVYTTVAELSPADLNGMIGAVGGKIILVFALLGFIGLLFYKIKDKMQPSIFVLSLLWVIGIGFASTKGVRFTMMFAPVVVILLSGFYLLFDKLAGWLSEAINLSKKYILPIGMILLFLSFVGVASSVNATFKNQMPLINDAMYDSLIYIKNNSSSNAILTSWWDFGHHFKYIADRPVTFDGGTQVTPQAHWVGKLLMTSNVNESRNILRMLDCGGNTLFEKYFNQSNDFMTAITRTYDDVESGRLCNNPPEGFLIISDDMVGKAGVWAHFGSWNFTKAQQWINYKEGKDTSMIGTFAGMSEDQANTWISPWPAYVSGVMNCPAGQCDNAVTFKNGTLASNGKLLANVLLVYNGTNEYYVQNNSEIPFGGTVWTDGVNAQVVLMAPELVNSVFNRLYFLEGAGLEDHYKLVSKQSNFLGARVLVYEVKW